jgi:hypothetical protein
MTLLNNTVPGEPFSYRCLLCKYAKGRANISERSGEWIVSCWSCTQNSYFFELAEKLNLRDPYVLKEDARRYLAPYITSNGKVEPKPLPTEAEVRDRWRFLREHDEALAYLLNERGLIREIITEYDVGYDGKAFWLPIREPAGELVTLKRRGWPKPFEREGELLKYLFTPGHDAAHVYPEVPATGPLILCEGEFDALVLRRHRLPSITVTTGMATHWQPQWSANWPPGRKVALLYDAGTDAEAQADKRCAEICDCGALAWVCSLSKAGLKDKEDMTDWFVTYGRTRAELLRLIKREREVTR